MTVHLIGPLGTEFFFEGGLAFAPDGTAYGSNRDTEDNPILFSINLGTGAATDIGTISDGQHDINGLAFRDDGMLVGLDRVTNALLAIDPSTAASTVIPVLASTGRRSRRHDGGWQHGILRDERTRRDDPRLQSTLLARSGYWRE